MQSPPQIPPGTASHTRMRLTGKGIRRASGVGYGDHYVHIRVEAPKNLDPRQRALIQAYAELERDTPGTVNGFTYDREGNKVRRRNEKLRSFSLKHPFTLFR